ncbi:MAG: ABC transporter permease [Chloroflexi bacterium]|nr:ABC transporter permease [Chloroflexota bacterium]
MRSPLRTTLVIALLAVGLSFALTSVALALAAQDELDKVKATTGVEASISINPGQFQAAIQEQLEAAEETDVEVDFDEIGAQIESLTSSDVDEIEALPYVRNAEGFATSSVNYGIPGQEDEEVDATEEPVTTEPGPDGEDPQGQGGQDGEDPQGQGGPGGGFNFTLPDATITGVDDPAFLSDFQEGTKVLAEGVFFAKGETASNVIIDQNTATLEGFSIGDTITLTAVSFGRGQAQEDDEDEVAAPEIEAEIIGIYQDLETSEQGGFGFSIEQWYAPLEVVRQLNDSEDENLSSISLVVGSVDDFDRLRVDLEEIIDPELFALTTSEDSFAAISDPIETMRNTSVVVMVAGLGVVGLIMVMLMVLVMRSRLREIGVLKAIGAKSRQVISQFALETIGVAMVAVVIAIPSVFVINTFLPDLIRPAAEAAAEEEAVGGFQGGGPGGGRGGGGFGRLVGGQAVDDPVRTEDIEAALNEIDASVSVEVIAVGAAAAIGLGLVGSLVTMFAVLRLRPAEVLRMEG